MTIVVPPLDPTWPAVDADELPTQEAQILHALVIEVGIPSIVLVAPELIGTTVPGDVAFDGDEAGWESIWAEFLRPLAGDYPGPVPRLVSGALQCAGWARRTRKPGQTPSHCRKAAADGSAYCDQHGFPVGMDTIMKETS